MKTALINKFGNPTFTNERLKAQSLQAEVAEVQN
jgi:hypothetical protein